MKSERRQKLFKRMRSQGFYEKKNIQQKFLDQEQNFEELICSICLEYLVHPKLTNCGHIYCHQCILKCILKKNVCPLCKREVQWQELKGCLTIENMTSVILQKLEGKKLEEYQNSIEQYQSWYKRRYQEVFEIGMKIDVIDDDNIWCPAIIIDIKELEQHSPILLVQYVGWSNFYNEFICSNSERIAQYGFYTKRTGIPQYKIKNPNQIYGVLLDREEEIREDRHQVNEFYENFLRENSLVN